MRVMLANMLPWAEFRRTYGQPIATRELVKRRIARLAGLIAGADALVAWGSWLIDQGYRGELECIIAKIFGSEALKEAAIELFMKTHGGRSFLTATSSATTSTTSWPRASTRARARCSAWRSSSRWSRSTARRSSSRSARRSKQHKMKTLNPLNPVHLWQLRKRTVVVQQVEARPEVRRAATASRSPGLARELAEHVDFALESFARLRKEISATMVKHQLKLADRQCRMAELSQRVQDTVTMLVTALWAHQQKNEAAVAAADILCQDLRRKLTGERPSDRYFRDVSKLADLILAGGFEALTGVATRRDPDAVRAEVRKVGWAEATCRGPPYNSSSPAATKPSPASNEPRF